MAEEWDPEEAVNEIDDADVANMFGIVPDEDLEASAVDERGEEIRFPATCGHTNEYGWTCEREGGHSGPHMLNPENAYGAEVQAWNNKRDANPYLADLLEEEPDEVEEDPQKGESVVHEALLANPPMMILPAVVDSTFWHWHVTNRTNPRPRMCGHQSSADEAAGGRRWVCERIRGHLGPHMLRPGFIPQATIRAWDNHNPIHIVSQPDASESSEEEITFPVDSGNTCEHFARDPDAGDDREGWYCERAEGHDGYHMLRPGEYADASFEVWDDDGNPISATIPPAAEADTFVGWSNVEGATQCMHFAADSDAAGGRDGWYCERPAGHDGYHMLEPGKYSDQASFETWDDDGNPVGGGIPAQASEQSEMLDVSDSSDIWNIGNPCKHTGPDGFYCERQPGHGGPHMIRMSWHKDGALHTWDDDKNPTVIAASDPKALVEGLAVAPESDGSEYLKPIVLERVRRGADLLAGKLGPQWFLDIDLETHSEESEDTCIIAQAFGLGYDEAITEAFGFDEGHNRYAETADYGFYDNDDTYSDLDETWSWLVEKLQREYEETNKAPF